MMARWLMGVCVADATRNPHDLHAQTLGLQLYLEVSLAQLLAV